MTQNHTLSAVLNRCVITLPRMRTHWLAAMLMTPIARCSLLSCLLIGGLLMGDLDVAFSQERIAQAEQNDKRKETAPARRVRLPTGIRAPKSAGQARPAATNEATVSVINEVKDVGPMRAAQQAELEAARAETKGNREAYRQRAAEIKQKHLQQDKRGKYTDEIVKRYGGEIESTGSNPKDVRADVDLGAKNKAAADKLTQEWKSAGHKVEDHGYKVVNKTTDTTLWKPCSTPECLRVKVRDPDAWTTEGGLKATGNTERIRDPRGQYLDNAKKFFHAKDDFSQATANPDAIDELKTFESVKTAAKSLDKAAEAAGTKQADDFWQKVENIRKQYMDPWEAGIADPNDPPAKQVKDIEKFLADAETKMAAAEEVLTRRGQAIDQQVREKLQQDLKNAKQADPKNKAMDQEGAEAIKARRDKVKVSNEAVEDLLTQQGGKQPGKGTNAPDGGVIEEPVRLTETGEAPPKTSTPVEEPPVVAGSEPDATKTKTAKVNPDTEQAPVTEQPGAAGAESSLRKSAAAAAKSAATGAAVGSLLGAATTYLICMTVLSPDATNENCLTAAGQSVPEAGFWGAVATLGTAGAVVAGIYGVYQTDLAVKEAIEEKKRLSAANETEQQAASRLSDARVVEQEFISRARRACNYERALDVAKELRLRPPPPSWLAATMPHIEKGAKAQKDVTRILTLAANTSDRDSKAELLSLAHNVSAGVPCLRKKVEEAQDKLSPGGNEPHCIFVVDASGGSVWIGTEKRIKAIRHCDVIGGGRCGRGDKEPPKVIKKQGCYPSKEAAKAAWCQEMKGKNVEHWQLAHNSKAAVYGGKYWLANAPACPQTPEKKTFEDVKEKSPIAPAATTVCSRVAAAMKQGREHYFAGRVSDYRQVLNTSARELGGLSDPKACAEQRAEIASGIGQADLLDNVIKTVDQALMNCQSQQFQRLTGLLGKTSHPHVTQLRSRLERMATVAFKVGQADTALAGGNKVRAASLYREAAAGLNLEPGVCNNLVQQVRDGQERIHTASLAPKSGTSELSKSETSCKAKLGARGIAISNPDSLAGFTCGCESPYEYNGSACVPKKSVSELEDAANKSCRSSFGSVAYAKPNSSDYKNYGCLCGTGHTWNTDQTQCIKMTREQIIADANRRCQEANNNNKRTRAGKHLGNGQWTCVIERTRAQVIADAHRSCQVANRNKRARAVKQLNDGRWSCTIPGQRRVRQHQPNYNDAAAAAIAGAILMQGVGAMINSQIRRPPQQTYQPRVHTHRPPTYNRRPPARTGRQCNVRDPITGRVGCY
jgi:hypothetical protein